MSYAFAPAKINLYLHVTGRRSDGLPLLDSLLVCANLGDQIDITDSAHLSSKLLGRLPKASLPERITWF